MVYLIWLFVYIFDLVIDLSSMCLYLILDFCVLDMWCCICVLLCFCCWVGDYWTVLHLLFGNFWFYQNLIYTKPNFRLSNFDNWFNTWFEIGLHFSVTEIQFGYRYESNPTKNHHFFNKSNCILSPPHAKLPKLSLWFKFIIDVDEVCWLILSN